jgi:hypothetical protein
MARFGGLRYDVRRRVRVGEPRRDGWPAHIPLVPHQQRHNRTLLSWKTPSFSCLGLRRRGVKLLGWPCRRATKPSRESMVNPREPACAAGLVDARYHGQDRGRLVEQHTSTVIEPSHQRYRTRPIEVQCSDSTVPTTRRDVVTLMTDTPMCIPRDIGPWPSLRATSSLWMTALVRTSPGAAVGGQQCRRVLHGPLYKAV